MDEAEQALGESNPQDGGDELSGMAADFAARLSATDFRRLVHSVRGRSDLHDDVRSVPHAAGSLLDRMRRVGVPVPLSTPPLDDIVRGAAIAYGSHSSCDLNPEFLRSEMADFVRKGFWMVLPYSAVEGLAHLRLSPAGLVPQRDRRDRLIIDYTWSGVNPATVRLAPDSMQYGRALQRTLQRIYDADPKHGPVHMLKVDIADGFYRVWLSAADIPKLGVALPPGPDGEQLVAFPLVLPMGWVESPPHFCAVTETVADLANDALARGDVPDTVHRLEAVAASPAPTYDVGEPAVPMRHNQPTRHGRPLAYIDVFVDDFLGLANSNRGHRNRVRRALLRALDSVIRPLDEDDSPERQEPASEKKLRKGDGSWATQKILLGWLVDSVRGTINLPPHRIERLHEMLAGFEGKRFVSLKSWRQLLGELRSMMVAIPGAEGLFSHLQAALVSSKGDRVRVTKSARDELSDWRWLASDISTRPTSIAEVVRKPTSIVQAVDAAKPGMGGVAFDLFRPDDGEPLLWREPFPQEVQDRVVSWGNPHGNVTNSDLEQAAVNAGHDVVAQHVDVRHRTVGTASDNTPTVYWTLKGSVSWDAAVAYLLRLLALHRRFYRYSTTIMHLAGTINRMADDASRLWHLTDDAFLSHFETTYPQRRSWKLCRLRPAVTSSLICALSRKRSPPELYLGDQKGTRKSGPSGPASRPPSVSTPSCSRSPIPFPSCKSLPVELETVVSPSTASRYAHVLLKGICGPLARRSPGWATSTPG